MKDINGVRNWPTISLLHVYGDLSFLLYLLPAKHCSVENIQGKHSGNDSKKIGRKLFFLRITLGLREPGTRFLN